MGRLLDEDVVIDALERAQHSVDFCKEHGIDFSIDMDMARICIRKLPLAQPEIIRCNECAFCRSFLSDKVCSLGLLHNINSNMDFCSRAVRKPERRTDGTD